MVRSARCSFDQAEYSLSNKISFVVLCFTDEVKQWGGPFCLPTYSAGWLTCVGKLTPDPDNLLIITYQSHDDFDFNM